MAFDQTQRQLNIATGQIIVARREALGWVLRDVQQRSGLSLSVLHKYEHGLIQSAPRMDVLRKIAIALRLPLEDLIQPDIAYVRHAIARLP